MEKILILKDNYNSFEQYYIEKMRESGVETHYYYKSSSVIRKLWTHYGLIGDNWWLGEWKSRIKDFDIFIVFDSLHTDHLLKYLNKNKKSSARVIFWHWNPINNKREEKFYEKTKDVCEHWTFDPNDAKRLGIKYNKQFFFRQNIEEGNESEDIYFVGVDKNRYDTLNELRKEIKKIGLNTDFTLLPTEYSVHKDDEMYKEDSIDYLENIKRIKHAKAVVELTQKGQLGLTARALEALFFRKKLITDNLAIQNEALYNSNNVFILGKDSISELADFLISKKFLCNDDIEELYTFENWVRIIKDDQPLDYEL